MTYALVTSFFHLALEFGIEQQAAAEVGRDGGPIQNPSGYPLAGGKKSPILGASE